MSPRKIVPVRHAPILPVSGSPQTTSDEAVRARLFDDVEVTSLSVDDDFDLGGDPYNSTGQFVALQANKKK
jgi:hypothetical protein